MNTESNESTGKSVGGSSKILSISLIFGALLATASVGLFVMRRIKDKRRKNEAEDLKSIFPKKDLKLQSKNNALKDGDFEYHLQNTGKAHSKSDDFSTAETFMSIPSVFSSYGDFFNQDRLLSYDQYQKNIKKKCTSDISSMKSYSVSKENPSFKIDEYQLDVEEDDSVSTLSDYDIVDPESMQHAEGRNTEALVNEGRFRVLSNASFVSSSAESELDDESVDSPSVSFARELEL
jgi:hypothetical protein